MLLADKADTVKLSYVRKVNSSLTAGGELVHKMAKKDTSATVGYALRASASWRCNDVLCHSRMQADTVDVYFSPNSIIVEVDAPLFTASFVFCRVSNKLDNGASAKATLTSARARTLALVCVMTASGNRTEAAIVMC